MRGPLLLSLRDWCELDLVAVDWGGWWRLGISVAVKFWSDGKTEEVVEASVTRQWPTADTV